MDIICENCNKQFTVPKWRIRQGKVKYCSSKCKIEGFANKARRTVYFKCLICNKTATTVPSDPKMFCSRKCAGIDRSRRMKGTIPWNKGLKGIMPIPWNKGKKCPQFAGKNNPSWNGGFVKKLCLICNSEFSVIQSRKNIAKFCSKKCNGLWIKKNFRMEKSPSWRGGRSITRGYIRLYLPDYMSSMDDGYILEQRYIMEKHLGRQLKKGEVVHHINGDTEDNNIENLMLFKNHSEHIKFHQRQNGH